MATQSDLDKLRKQLSDLDAKLKSMRGNQKAPVARPPNFVDRGPDPSFEARMAFRNYANLRRDQKARIAAERGTPTPSVGKRDPRDQNTRYEGPKAPTQPRPSGPDFIDNRDPNMNYTMNMVNYIDPATGEVTSRTNGIVPGPGSRFVRYYGPPPEGQGGSMTGFVPVPSQRPTQGPQVGGDFTQGRLMGAPVEQQPGYGIPQGPQNAQNAMATYNNLLQQGIQRSNTLNQDAASNFANMQAGAPTTQPAAPAKANPTMPIAGMGMQQPKATPAPRKFSTVNTPSARFG